MPSLGCFAGGLAGSVEDCLAKPMYIGLLALEAFDYPAGRVTDEELPMPVRLSNRTANLKRGPTEDWEWRFWILHRNVSHSGGCHRRRQT